MGTGATVGTAPGRRTEATAAPAGVETMVREIAVVQARVLAATSPVRRLGTPRIAAAGHLGTGAASSGAVPPTDGPTDGQTIPVARRDGEVDPARHTDHEPLTVLGLGRATAFARPGVMGLAQPGARATAGRGRRGLVR